MAELEPRGLYYTSRVILGAFLHPVATFKANILIGDKEEIERNFNRSLRIPGFKDSGNLKF